MRCPHKRVTTRKLRLGKRREKARNDQLEEAEDILPRSLDMSFEFSLRDALVFQLVIDPIQS